jgi:hypothetical protein
MKLEGHADTAQNQLDMVVEGLCDGQEMTAELRARLMTIQKTAGFLLHNAGHMRNYTPQGVAAAIYRGVR